MEKRVFEVLIGISDRPLSYPHHVNRRIALEREARIHLRNMSFFESRHEAEQALAGQSYSVQSTSFVVFVSVLMHF